MKTVLVKAFEPFGGEALNPSWEAVCALDGNAIGGAPAAGSLQRRAGRAQCRNGRGAARFNSLGRAGGRSDINEERIGINVDDARIPDNASQQPVDEPIVPDGPAGYFSTLPIKAIVAVVREAGSPASVSQTADTFTFNRVMYGRLHRLHTQGNRVRGGFVHIPYLPA
ncbi:pyroglutamyl-peptidase I family protein [Candidatus Pantoea persica]|uniref:pyroglutamyl-peptidase I family protein n=1 Tax=Candidatus Pantoea persica TaxID=2518128 RepID=UPI00403DB066|nr:Pyrrolidone-carboxylate peptidase [Candidatus Pantoea persica]